MPSTQFHRCPRLIVWCSVGLWWLITSPTAQATEWTAKAELADTQAIVQLQGLPLTSPKIQGATILPLTLTKTWQLLTIEGQVQQQSETFLIDTGASTTLLSKALVRRLGLQGEAIPGDRLSSAVAGETCPPMDANLHRLPPFRLGSVQVNELQGLEFLHNKVPYDLSGILGMNLLSAFDLKIYPKARQLSLSLPNSSPRSLPLNITPPRTGLWRSPVISLQRRLGVMLTQVKLNERGPFTFLLDTGAASTFISPQVAQAARVTDQLRHEVKVQGFCGLESAYRVMTPTLQLGIYQVQQVETIVLDSSVLKTLEVDGILGQNVLNRFDQHWQFPDANLPDAQAIGSLHLSPVSPVK